MEVEDVHMCLVCKEKITGLMNYVSHKQSKCTAKKDDTTSSQEENITSPPEEDITSPQEEDVTSPQDEDLTSPPEESNCTEISETIHHPTFPTTLTSFITASSSEQNVNNTLTSSDNPATPYFSKKNNVHLVQENIIDLPRLSAEQNVMTLANIVLQPVPIPVNDPVSYNMLPPLSAFHNDESSHLQSSTEDLKMCRDQSGTDIQDGLSLDINQLSKFMNDEFPASSQSLCTNSITSPSTDSFFQSLELQSRKSPNKNKLSGNQDSRINIYSTEYLSITNFLNNLDFSSDDDITNFPSGDELDNSYDLNYRPPRAHTGGKWKPGEHPRHTYQSSGKKMPGGKWKPGMLGKQNKVYKCELCNLSFKSCYAYSAHCRCKKHKQAHKISQSPVSKGTIKSKESKDAKVKVEQLGKRRSARTPVKSKRLKTDHNESSSNKDLSPIKNDDLAVKPSKPVVSNVTKEKKSEDMGNEADPDKPPETPEIITKAEKQEDQKNKLQEKHTCTICEKTFSRKYEMVKHVMTPFHRNRAIKHPDALNVLIKYENYVVKLSAYQCHICQFYFNRHSDLVDHMSTPQHYKLSSEHFGALTCLLCEENCEDAEELKNHVLSVHHMESVDKAKHSKICVIKDLVDLKCKYCGLKQNSFKRLRLHIICRHKDKKVRQPFKRSTSAIHPKCPHCTSTFAYPSALKLHIKRVHSQDRPHKCEACDKGFVNRYAYYKHVNTSLHRRRTALFIGPQFATIDKSEESVSEGTASDIKRVSSDKLSIRRSKQWKSEHKCHSQGCEFKTTQYSELKQHCQEEHASDIMYCKLCDSQFLSNKAYRLHCLSQSHQTLMSESDKMDQEVLDCPKCPKKFTDEKWRSLHLEFNHNHVSTEAELLKIHGTDTKVEQLYGDHLKQIKSIAQDAAVSCPECGKFIQHERIVEHLRLHTGEKPFTCNLCERAFISRLSLRRHLMVHVGLTEKTCNICNQEFKRFNSYNAHMERHRSKETHQCSECGACFPLLKQLNAHMTRHRERNFKCQFKGCTWSFVLKNELKMHMVTHTGEKKYLCDICGLAAVTKTRLRRHYRTHSGERNFSCEYCTYKAGNSTHLKRHMRIHIGAKPFQCPYCQYSCNTHENIRKHILKTKKHAGLSVYPCKSCDYGSNSSQEFRNHLINVHGQKINTDGLDKLAEYSGLYIRQNDPKQPVEGTQILHSKERKKSHSPLKKIKISELKAFKDMQVSKRWENIKLKKELKKNIKQESSPIPIAKTLPIPGAETSSIPTSETEQLQGVIPPVPTPEMRIDWDQSGVPNVTFNSEVIDEKSGNSTFVEVLPLQPEPTQALPPNLNYYHLLMNDHRYQQQ